MKFKNKLISGHFALLLRFLTLKRKCILIIGLLWISPQLFAQKPPLDIKHIGSEKWPGVVTPAISNNGLYLMYTVNNWPAGNNTIVFRATRGSWESEIPGVTSASFTEDNSRAVFMKGNDSLCLLTLSTSIMKYLPGVSRFQLFKQGNIEILAIQKNNPAKELVLRNLKTDKEQLFAGVDAFVLARKGNSMLLVKTITGNDKSINQSLVWADLISGKTKTIWRGSNSGNFIFDDTGSQLAFVEQEMVNSRIERSFWYYKGGTDQALMIVNQKSTGVDPDLILESLSNFSKDGTRIFFKQKEADFPIPKPAAAKVDVWNYRDAKLQSQQLKETKYINFLVGGGPRSFISVIDVSDHHIIRLEQENETLEFPEKADGEIAFLRHTKGDVAESWSSAGARTEYLVFTKTGERKELKFIPYNLSPDGRYVAGRNADGSALYTYEIASGTTHDITKDIPVPISDAGDDRPSDFRSRGFSVAAWLPGDKKVLIYDKYDIWQLDPSGREAAVNLTNSYGRKNDISLRIIGNNQTIASNQPILLSAFNRVNKNNGFFRMVLGKKGDPEQLTMGPYVYFNADLGYGSAPLKARDADWYVVLRQSASESPNFFQTKDLRTFKPLSAVYPEKDYNWMTSELVNFKTLDGKSEQGALYKPENFDPNKRYPLIIQYYELKSNLLNTYHEPETSMDNINIPWFVSHGYLVFTPDIHYTIGEPGESAYKSVVGAADYLKTLPYVDAKKMGIQGHSFGGFETNYIVTHTDLFAAALSAAGPSDMLSFYNDMWGDGNSKQSSLEFGQIRMGTTPWEKPDLYFKNSPILRADKITTPLLMMQNKEDGAISFHQGTELFTALRRLGKRAWLLQYDNETHSVFNPNNRVDYTIRMTQFFDHYLKDAPTPEWMLKGIPAKLKGIDDGLRLDTTGATPGPGLLLHPDTKEITKPSK